jgi:hypothetical protein
LEFCSTRFRHPLVHALLVCAAFALPASLANGTPLKPIYGVTDSDQFGSLNLSTLVFSPISTLGFVPYSLIPAANGFIAISETGLLESVSYSGTAALIGNTGLTPSAMAEIGSTVYLLDSTSELYTVNTTNAAVSAVGPTGLGDIALSTFHSSLQAVGNELYYTYDPGSGSGTLYEIDPSDASTTTIGSTIVGIDAAIFYGNADYAFEDNDADPSASTEYTLNLANGDTASVGAVSGGTALYGVAAAPEPGSLVLMFAGLLATAYLMWRRNGRGLRPDAQASR